MPAGMRIPEVFNSGFFVQSLLLLTQWSSKNACKHLVTWKQVTKQFEETYRIKSDYTPPLWKQQQCFEAICNPVYFLSKKKS